MQLPRRQLVAIILIMLSGKSQQQQGVHRTGNFYTASAIGRLFLKMILFPLISNLFNFVKEEISTLSHKCGMLQSFHLEVDSLSSQVIDNLLHGKVVLRTSLVHTFSHMYCMLLYSKVLGIFVKQTQNKNSNKLWWTNQYLSIKGILICLRPVHFIHMRSMALTKEYISGSLVATSICIHDPISIRSSTRHRAGKCFQRHCHSIFIEAVGNRKKKDKIVL